MATNVYIEETVVVPILTKMRCPRWVLIELGTATAGERANVAEYEPPNVAGFETWRWGTRFAREHKTLKELGWVLCDRDQVSGIRNASVGIKLVVCNTDHNTANPKRAPKNLSERGAASRRLIESNANQLLMPFIKEERRDDLWYFCCNFSETSILMELSRPISHDLGYIDGYSDRIIIAGPGEVPGIKRFTVPQEFADVPRPRASRKA